MVKCFLIPPEIIFCFSHLSCLLLSGIIVKIINLSEKDFSVEQEYLGKRLDLSDLVWCTGTMGETAQDCTHLPMYSLTGQSAVVHADHNN